MWLSKLVGYPNLVAGTIPTEQCTRRYHVVQYYLEFVSSYPFKFNDLALYGIIDIPGIWTDMLQARL